MAVDRMKDSPTVRRIVETISSVGSDIKRRFRPMGGLLDYLESGRLPGKVDRSPPFPDWVSSGCLRIEDSYIKVEGVYVTRFLPGVHLAYLDFSLTEKPEVVPVLNVVLRNHDQPINPVGGAGHSFGLWPLIDDLRKFAWEFAPSRIEAMNNNRVQDTCAAEEWLKEHI